MSPSDYNRLTKSYETARRRLERATRQRMAANEKEKTRLDAQRAEIDRQYKVVTEQIAERLGAVEDDIGRDTFRLEVLAAGTGRTNPEEEPKRRPGRPKKQLTFGQTMKKKRESLGWKADEAAKKLGMHVSTLYRIEADDGQISDGNFKKLVQVYGLRVDKLAKWTG
jgi:multidrug efflux pump subunit AcrA (membrane-fusion protein)